jgi:hypothetical protein
LKQCEEVFNWNCLRLELLIVKAKVKELFELKGFD